MKTDNNKSCWPGNPDSKAAGREIQAEEEKIFSDARAGQSWLNPHSLSNQDGLPSWGTPAKQTNGSEDLREKTPGTGQIQIQLRFPFRQGKHKCEALTSYRTYAGLLGWFLFWFGLWVFFFPCFGMYLKVTQMGFNLNLSTPSLSGFSSRDLFWFGLPQAQVWVLLGSSFWIAGFGCDHLGHAEMGQKREEGNYKSKRAQFGANKNPNCSVILLLSIGKSTSQPTPSYSMW